MIGAKEGGLFLLISFAFDRKGGDKTGQALSGRVKVSAEVKKRRPSRKSDGFKIPKKNPFSHGKRPSPAVYGSNNPRNKITSENITRWLLFLKLSLKYCSHI